MDFCGRAKNAFAFLSVSFRVSFGWSSGLVEQLSQPVRVLHCFGAVWNGTKRYSYSATFIPQGDTDQTIAVDVN